MSSLSLSVEGGEARWVEAAARFAGDCANRLGVDGALVEEACAEACRNVVAHAYQDGELIRYRVSVAERDGSLVIGVADPGLTFSLARLENLKVDPKITTASDWGAEIRDYVVSCAP